MNKKYSLKEIVAKITSSRGTNAVLLLSVLFLVVNFTQAATPNPGHPWTEVGDGLVQFSTPTALRTYTLPDANATLFSNLSIIPSANGGTGNASTSFTGMTAARAYTLPDANTTLLSTNPFSQGDLLYGTGASTTATLPKDTNATRYLSNTGTSNNPAWSLINLVNGVSGILSSANGGTGNASTSFTGQTSARTYTLPDANTTLLSTNAAVTLGQGGTGVALTASNGGIVYSGASTLAILAGTSTAGTILQSGASGAPSWSGATYPSTAGASTLGNVITSDGTNYVSTQNIPNAFNRTMTILANAGAATATNLGFPAAPTLTATASNGDDNFAPWVNQATSAVSGNTSGVISAAFNYFRINYNPKMASLIQTDPTATTTTGIWVGMFSAAPDNAPAPNIHAASFRYYSSVDATPFWRAVTIAGTGASATVTATTVAVAPATTYEMYIDCTSGVNCKFYINGALVATNSATLPASGTTLGYGARITTLAGSARNLKWSKISITHD